MSKYVSMAVIIWAAALSFALTDVAIGQAKPPPSRIGTFDSRAVALAFWRSEKGIEDLRKKEPVPIEKLSMDPNH